jgi:hypothetical protein
VDNARSPFIYNVGSGQARMFLDKAKIMFSEIVPRIEFIELQEKPRVQLRNYGQAQGGGLFLTSCEP